MTSGLLARPPHPGPARTTPPPDGDDWFWVDLDALRQAYLDAGFVEHRHTTEPNVVLMADSPNHPNIEVILNTDRSRANWRQCARTAIGVLEKMTGTTHAHLGALTEREAELWRTLTETRNALEAAAGT